MREFKRDFNRNTFDKKRIDAALNLFWLERARTAPLAGSLLQHTNDQDEYLAATYPGVKDSDDES